MSGFTKLSAIPSRTTTHAKADSHRPVRVTNIARDPWNGNVPAGRSVVVRDSARAWEAGGGESGGRASSERLCSRPGGFSERDGDSADSACAPAFAGAWFGKAGVRVRSPYAALT